MNNEIFGIDKSKNSPQVIEIANCITAREDRGVSNRKAEGTAVVEKCNKASGKKNASVDRVVCEQRCDEGIRFFKDDVCGSLRTIDSCGDKRVIEAETIKNLGGTIREIEGKIRIRKLTPKECFRLMGFEDSDFEKAESICSNAQLYKQAGNSIVVPVVEYIIKALIECGALENEREEKEMELRVKTPTFPEVIQFNFEELKQEITAKSSEYVNLVYTDEQISEAKKDRAKLNKFVKALSDERIKIKKECLKPYEDFEAKIKELDGIVSAAIKNIDDQVKGYEEKQKADKLAAIEGYWKACEKPFEIPLEKVMSKTWLNASVSLKSVYGAIDVFLEKTASDLATLQNLPEFSFEAVEVYKSTLDLNKSISEGQKLADMAKRKEEAERQKAEAELEKHMNPPVEEPCEIPHEAFEDCRQNQKEPQRQWIGFKANLTVEEAHQLKNFFDCRGIEFEAIAI